MNNIRKKILAPVIIVLLIILYYSAAGVFLFKMQLAPGIKTALVLVPLIITGVMIWVLVERIKEIRSGEEDDLGEY
jgi:hypothetical protein